MTVPKILTFGEAIADSEQYSKRHLILGNGFSIGCRPDIFHYASLFDRTDFTNDPELRQLFEALKTHDFEIAIKGLENCAKIAPIYLSDRDDITKKILAHAQELKSLLVETIANNHPAKPGDISDEMYWACRKFLRHFLSEGKSGQVYTLNYDLLLYWALMHDDGPLEDEM